MKNLILFGKSAMLTALACISFAIHATTTFFGPTPYLSFSDSPFANQSHDYFYLENFEDGVLNTPGVTASPGWVPFTSGGYRDSVDADDGNIGGSGSQGNSYISNFHNSQLLITFNASDLGENCLPTQGLFGQTSEQTTVE